MTEYPIRFVMDLRLTGDSVVEADSLDQARAVAQQMLDHHVFDIDFTIYEGEVQSEDMFWDQERFEIGVRSRQFRITAMTPCGPMRRAPHQARLTQTRRS